MAATQLSQAIATAANLVVLAGQMLTLEENIVIANNAWSDDQVATTLASMATCAVNADGSLGAADATPNPAHPIDPRVYPTMPRAISSTLLGQVLTAVLALQTYLNGSAVSANVGARAILNECVGG